MEQTTEHRFELKKIECMLSEQKVRPLEDKRVLESRTTRMWNSFVPQVTRLLSSSTKDQTMTHCDLLFRDLEKIHYILFLVYRYSIFHCAYLQREVENANVYL